MFSQSQIFLDNFNRSNLNTGAPTVYTTTITSGDGAAEIISSSILEITNDATTNSNANGIAYVSGLTQCYSGFSQILHSNNGSVEWTFNFRYNRTSNPSGLNGGSYGTAIILAASSGIFSGTGAANGYAIVYASSGTTDPIRLVRFTNGITGTLIDIVNSGLNDIANVNNYVSVRVHYEPTIDNWSLFIRDDGASNWTDPSIGNYNQKGSTTRDTTYTTIALTHFGFYWAYATTVSQTSQFDNFGVHLLNTTNPLITVNVTSLPSFGTLVVGDSSALKSFTVSGINLSDNITITPSEGFEIRTGSELFSTNTITITPIISTVVSTTIDVRFKPESIGTYSGSINCASFGATTRNVSVNGIGSSANLEIYITSDFTVTDSSHSIVFPHYGMGTGTVYGNDDWTYSMPKQTLYITPVGIQSFCATEFEICWDTSKVNITASNGNMFDFFIIQNVAPGNIRINSGASSNLNVTPTFGKYLATLECSILEPGHSEIILRNTDFRYFDGDSQQSIQTTTHPNIIKYYLGDFASSQEITNTGDGRINFEDLVLFALAYFSESDGSPSGYKAKFDIGPTNVKGSYFTFPNPDGRIQFEDLVIFSIGYGKTASNELTKSNTNPIYCHANTPFTNIDGTIVVPLVLSDMVTDVCALSITISYPSSLEYIGVNKYEEMNRDKYFLMAKADGNTVILDAATLGSDNICTSESGVFAYAIFKPHTQQNHYDINIQSAIIRDRHNRDIPVRLTSNSTSVSTIPISFELSQNYPNPFNPTTWIEYRLSSPVHTEISIYDVLGRYTRTLVNENQSTGFYNIQWDGKDANQKDVSSGIYFIRMRAYDQVDRSYQRYMSTKKLVLLK